jgi:hypothetical protein
VSDNYQGQSKLTASETIAQQGEGGRNHDLSFGPLASGKQFINPGVAELRVPMLIQAICNVNKIGIIDKMSLMSKVRRII